MRTLVTVPTWGGITFSQPTGIVGAVTSGGGGFQTPNVINEASFETGFDGFTALDTVSTPTGVSRDNTLAAPGGGSWSVKRPWVPSGSDAGTSFGFFPASTQDRYWWRFYYRQTAVIDTILKFFRFNHGGLFAEADPTLGFSFNDEDSGHNHPIGILNSTPLDGNFHSIEVDYWRNGDPSGFPSAQFWFDGAESYLSDRTLTGGAAPAYWSNKRLYAGERVTSQKLDWFEFLATLNGGVTTTGQINVDRVCLSTLGRIGP